MRVFVECFEEISLKKTDSLSFNHPLARRMSFLQKAGLEVMSRIEKDYPMLLDSYLYGPECEIFYTTTYGELQAVHTIANQINAKELPVSPLAFQHSVNNAAAGYLSIIKKVKKNVVTLGSGYLALDKAIYSIFHRLKNEPETTAILVHGDEYLFQNEDQAQAQVQFFAFSNFAKTKWQRPLELLDIVYRTDEIAEQDFDKDHPLFARFDNLKQQTFERTVRSQAGELIHSHWSVP